MPLKNIAHAALQAGADFYVAPAANAAAGRPDGVSTVLGLQVANKTTQTGIIRITWKDASNGNAETSVAHDITVPGNSSLNVLDNMKVVLEAGDSLRAVASANAVFDITGAVSED